MKNLMFLFLVSCSTVDSITCFSIDGKAASSCKAFKQYERLCKDRGGVEGGNALFGYCKDKTKIERKY